jgi:hypothetical protein
MSCDPSLLQKIGSLAALPAGVAGNLFGLAFTRLKEALQ